MTSVSVIKLRALKGNLKKNQLPVFVMFLFSSHADIMLRDDQNPALANALAFIQSI